MMLAGNDVSLIVRGLCKAYGDHRVLRDITFEVMKEEFLCIIGSSGCGKTTLLRSIAGFEPYIGKILHNGELVEKPSPKRFMVFQELNQLLPWKTVEGNILFGLLAGNPLSEISVEGLISLVGLEGFGDHYPHQLSGGMKQRAAIARALFVQPSLLLMDEPFGSLDAHTRRRMRLELLRIWERLGKTVIFVTHNIREAVQLADRIIILSREGEISADILIDLFRPRDIASHDFGLYWGKILNLMEVN